MIISSEKRAENIFTKAKALGFNMPDADVHDAQEFLLSKAPVDGEEECEVTFSNGTETYNYYDSMGYSKDCWGEIVNWESYRNAEDGDKIYYDKVVNSLGEVIELYIVKK